MPRRKDLESVLIIGSGPIVIGQACEFDYSGTQACKALREEGLRVVLINSNPATIMTDPELADATYVEPLTVEVLDKVLAHEKVTAILPTLGGQTGLNLAMAAEKAGLLDKHHVELLGATVATIEMAEDRELFKQAMARIGLACPRSRMVHSVAEARACVDEIGFPTILRPSFTMGGSGGGIAYNRAELDRMVQFGLDQSPVGSILIEESVLGWKEYELEVVRDAKDNAVIVCSIENLDPMGVHTGDSITVAPAMTLTDKEYQRMRDAAIAVMREIGVTTGGSNVQFAVDPKTGRMLVIEMNPRVSRSSALASKATGFPIAKVAAKLAVGYTLDELKNEITGGATPASFEPTIDYVVTKIPRFTFEKFPQAADRLTTQMKSVGEVMAIGRTFQESLQKAMRGLEISVDGFNPVMKKVEGEEDWAKLRHELKMAGSRRLWYVGDAFRFGLSLDEIQSLTNIDRWFLVQIQEIVALEKKIAEEGPGILVASELRPLKRKGFSDRRIADLIGVKEKIVRTARYKENVRPVFKRVDSCAAEFASATAYLYSTYEEYCEADPTDREKIMILGGGPNRIGQGIEFDYCCVHASFALKESGFETIMVNCNPETVSTDYDTSDRLYFEPVTLEDVLEIVHKEKPKGVIVTYGGQTPLKLARALEEAGVPIIGTSRDSIDLAEDRERFQQLVHKLKLKQPPNRTARDVEEAVAMAKEVGYPLIVRPSYVLGGRAMEIVHGEDELRDYVERAVSVSNDSPILLDRFLDLAVEVDVDAISDGEEVIVAGIMEHVEQAGIHSGDSGCSLPPFSLSPEMQRTLTEQVRQMAQALKVNGIMNTQFAIQNGVIYVLEVNPRASRTIPFVSKAIGQPLAKIAAKAMAGITFKQQGVSVVGRRPYYSVKESVFPFIKFPDADPILGPEMKSTGEVMGTGRTFGEAYAKAQIASGVVLPRRGLAFISVRDRDKPGVVELGKMLVARGFEIVATGGTAQALADGGVPCQRVNKVREGRPHVVDMIKNRELSLIVNTTEGKQAIRESHSIRGEAVHYKVTYYTSLAAAKATCDAIDHIDSVGVNRLQDLHAEASV